MSHSSKDDGMTSCEIPEMTQVIRQMPRESTAIPDCFVTRSRDYQGRNHGFHGVRLAWSGLTKPSSSEVLLTESTHPTPPARLHPRQDAREWSYDATRVRARLRRAVAVLRRWGLGNLPAAADFSNRPGQGYLLGFP